MPGCSLYTVQAPGNIFSLCAVTEITELLTVEVRDLAIKVVGTSQRGVWKFSQIGKEKEEEEISEQRKSTVPARE